jgi:hypothetical protein
VSLPVSINLADSGGNGWEDLLSAIEVAQKYVALDLSGSTMLGTEFGYSSYLGKSWIVSLVLPDTALSIKAGDFNNSTFRGFNNLESVSGGNVVTIGDYAFSGRTALVEVNLPKVETIGNSAFSGCTALAEVDFPEVTSISNGTTIYDSAFSGCIALIEINLPKAVTIGDYTFYGCTALVEVNLPMVETIGQNAFYGCTALVEVDFPKATSIGQNAFYGCTGMVDVNLPKATSIGWRTFNGCPSLATVDLAEATSIDGWAFDGCTALKEVNLPMVEYIESTAFYETGSQALTITLPKVAPSLDDGAVISSTYSKTITIKTPAGRTGYDDSYWEHQFKFQFGGSGAAITLIFEGDPLNSAGTGLVSVQFTGPQDENITLTDVDAAALSWTANTALTVSVSGSFTTYRWVLDDVERSETGSTLTLYVRNLAVKRHSLTVFVTKNAVEYAKRVTFTVAQ